MVSRETLVFKHEDIYYRHVRGRSLVYLDQNIWINLEEGRYPDVLLLLQELRRRDRIICPLSYALVGELFDQPIPENRKRRAKLMDELSGGIIVRHSSIRERNEVTSIFTSSNRDLLHKEHGYSVVVEYLGNFLVTPADQSLVARKVAEFCAKFSETSEELRSVSWFVEHLDLDNFRVLHQAQLQDYVTKCEVGLAETRRDMQNIPKAQRKEHALYRMRIKKLIQYACYLRTRNEDDLCLLPHAETKKVENFQLPLHHCKEKKKVSDLIKEPNEPDGKPNKKLVGAFFQEIPTIDLVNQYYTGTYLGVRRPKAQDYYDVEHMTTVPYVDYFVTADGYLRDSLRSSGLLQRYNCQLVDDVAGLMNTVGNLLRTNSC